VSTVSAPPVTVRRARPGDIAAIRAITAPHVVERRIVPKAPVAYYEAVPEFMVAVVDGVVVGCGALHVMWDDLAEIRTLAVLPAHRGLGVGHRLLDALLTYARRIGLRRVFCLTFEVDFFGRFGFHEIAGIPVTPAVYAELLQSPDDGIAEFLDLARVKPNTLGNTRMLLEFEAAPTNAVQSDTARTDTARTEAVEAGDE
jgi:amino-acid N-acetyltransferase